MIATACGGPTPSDMTRSADAVEQDLIVVTDDRIRLVSQDGVETEVLAAAGARQPVVSDDGRSVAWAVDNGVVVWDGTESTGVDTPFAPFYLSWAADADALVALGNAATGSGVEAVLVEVGSRAARSLVIDRPVFFDWVADGSAAVFHLGSDRLASIDRNGDIAELGRDAGGFGAPQVIADGRVLVASRQAGPLTASLAQVPVAEVVEVRLLDLERSESELVFTADSQVSFAASADGRVAVLAGRVGHGVLTGELTVIDLESGDQRRVGSDSVAAFAWSPDGSNLLVLSLDGDHTGLTPAVWDGERSTVYPGFVPTPSLLVNYLPFWDQYLRSHTPWSLDGTAFVYSSHAGGVDRVFIQHLGDSEPVEVTDGSFAAFVSSRR